MTANKATTAHRAAKVAGALAKATLPALLLAGAPLATGFVLFSVLMGPTGMQPVDVAAATADSLLVRAAVVTVGLAALAPAVVALGRAELGYFRWLPIPTGAFWATRATFLLLLDLPFALFWSAAAGPASGLAALTLMAGFHASLLVRGGRGPLLAALAGAILLAFPTLPGWSTIGGVAVIAVAVPLGWRRAEEGRARALAVRPRGAPLWAIATLLAVDLADPLLAVRVLVAAIAFGGISGLVIASNQLAAAPAIAVAVAGAAIGAVGVAANVAAKCAASWRQLRWLLRANATTNAAQTGALVLVTGSSGALTGAAIGAAVVLVAKLPLGASLVVVGASMLVAAPITLAALSRAARAETNSTMLTWIGAIGAAIALVTAIVIAGLPALVLAPAGSLLAAIDTHDAVGREISL